MMEARSTSSGRDQSDALSAYRQRRSNSFKGLAAAMQKISSSLVPGAMVPCHGNPSGMSAESGAKPLGSTFTRTS